MISLPHCFLWYRSYSRFAVAPLAQIRSTGLAERIRRRSAGTTFVMLASLEPAMSQEAITSQTVEEAVLPGLHRGKRPKDQDLRMFIINRFEPVNLMRPLCHGCFLLSPPCGGCSAQKTAFFCSRALYHSFGKISTISEHMFCFSEGQAVPQA